MSRYPIVLLALLVSGCSAGAYQTEVTGMVAAGRVIVAAPASYQTARNEMVRLARDSDLMNDVLSGSRLSGEPPCIEDASAIDSRYRAVARGDRNAQDSIFAEFRALGVCVIGGPDPDTGTDYKPSKLEGELASRLATYLSGLEGIISGDTITEIEQALTEAKEAGRGLAEAASAPPAAAAGSDVVFTLLAINLEHRRYAALREAVMAFDPAWRAAAPDVGQSLRMHHLSLIRDRARLAAQSRTRMITGLNDERVLSTGLERAEIYDRLNGELGARNAALRAALDADPAATIDAFTKAHGKLLEALNDPDRPTAGVLEAVAALVSSARALDAALDGEAE